MATQVGNSELQNMLNQAMAQLQTVGGGNSAFTQQGTQFINSIYTVAESENKEEQVNASVNIIQGLLDFINTSKNKTIEANKKVQDNSNNIGQNNSEAEQKAQAVNAKIEELSAKILTGSTNISNAIKEIESLKNEDSDIQEIQDKILEQLTIINSKKADLNDPEKREEALKAIGAATTTIDSYVELLGQTILAVQEKIETQNNIVTENVNEVTQNISDSAAQISEGVVDIQKYITKNTNEAAKATEITTDGGLNDSIGNAEITAAEAINSNGFSALFSGGKGVKLFVDGNQRINAGQIEINGGIANLSQVMSGIGKMGSDISSLTEQTNALGKVGNGVLSLVGTYEQTVNPYISALGTYDISALTSANAELHAQVKQWEAGNLENTENPKQATNGNEEDDQLTTKFKSAFVPKFGI